MLLLDWLMTHEISTLQGAAQSGLPPRFALNAVNALGTYEKTFSDPEFIIDPLILRGTTLLGGRPKGGKSWLGLQIALSVARGEDLMQGMNVITPGRVLYLALEDTERRINKRLKGLTDSTHGLDNIDFVYDMPEKLNEGGIERLSGYVQAVQYKVVIIDTLLAAMGKGDAKHLVKSDYAEAALIRDFANQHKLGCVVICHTRKQEAENPIDAILGTTGVTAAVDAILLLEKVKGKTALNLISREVEEQTYSIGFDLDNGGWNIVDAPKAKTPSEERLAIIELLKTSHLPLFPVDMAFHLGKTPEQVRYLVKAMKDAGQLVVNPDGTYRVP